ncbi:transcriptional regulator [Clostridium carboxidivorans P7]|uniref:Transcriptional regulator, ArsR family n=1 Tax=Clostridium carboxidivorans P7 TaxID=536227 RepID=C6PSR0_9CLOT|nr:metalloregulator ArsR/SmtB family transcription factor [Clostridium carboxidivorans]AKN31638.1 transcriptional regulator [Clostridium carboxidivorans P7]EET87739.1 transcriptional regulator, ArsR family [Clostridium carboxidivorans P7]
MAVTINLSDYSLKTNETLIQRIQFVYSPLNELFRSLHVLLNFRHHGMNIEWVLQSQHKLDNDFYDSLHYFCLIYELGVPPIFFNDFRSMVCDIDTEINQLKTHLASIDNELIITQLKKISTDRENSFIPTLAKSLEWGNFRLNDSHNLLDDLSKKPKAVYDRLFEFIAIYRKQVFDKTWENLKIGKFLSNEIKEQSNYLKNHGFVNMINHLQVDRLHWQSTKLIVTKPFEENIELNDRDSILLIPSYFIWPHLFVEQFEEGVIITYDALNKLKKSAISNENELTSIFHALSDPIRLQIMKYLFRERSTTQSLAQVMIMSQSSISRHLQILKNAGLVESKKDRKFVLYSTTDLLNSIFPSFYSYLNFKY